MFSKRVILTAIALFSVFCLTACGGAGTEPPEGFDGGGDLDGGDCEVTCTTSADCCEGMACSGGVCVVPTACPSGCNWECDKAAGQTCNRSSHLCEDGPPPANCVDGCDCFTGEACIEARCLTICSQDADCPTDQVCEENACQPTPCQTREDCDLGACLICKSGRCAQPPGVCQGDAECCVGYVCSFGSCVLVEQGCQADSDCLDPALPRCEDYKCVPAEVECQIDADCPEPDQVCQDQRCVTPGCTPESCLVGQWCDRATGLCKVGCDSNDDCMAPDTCNYGTHQCGQMDCCGGLCTPDVQVCDPQTCQCRDLCANDLDCPAAYTCRQADGRCVCTDLACADGTHCDPGSGQCVADAGGCQPADFSQAIACDSSASGTFEVGCEATHRPGSYAKQFTFTGSTGQTVTIDLSSAVDSFLYLLDPTGAQVASNDDGGGDQDARIVYAIASDGTHTIEATTSGPGVSGSFDLTLACSDAADCTEPLGCGNATSDTWGPDCVSSNLPGSSARWYTFQGTAGDTVTISLSSDADAYLFLLNANGTVLTEDDDGGSGLDSRIIYSLQADGTYVIEATTLDGEVVDDFDISLACSSGSDCEQPIACGQVIAENFEPGCEAVNRPGRYAKVFLFDAVANQTVSIDLWSDAVDTYLFLYAPSGEYVDSNDDADFFTTNSQLYGTFSDGGTWFIEATTYRAGQTGPFFLEVTCY